MPYDVTRVFCLAEFRIHVPKRENVQSTKRSKLFLFICYKINSYYIGWINFLDVSEGFIIIFE